MNQATFPSRAAHLFSQLVQVTEVEIGREPALKGRHQVGHVRSDVGIAVAVTAHPGAEANGAHHKGEFATYEANARL